MAERLKASQGTPAVLNVLTSTPLPLVVALRIHLIPPVTDGGFTARICVRTREGAAAGTAAQAPLEVGSLRGLWACPDPTVPTTSSCPCKSSALSWPLAPASSPSPGSSQLCPKALPSLTSHHE